MLSVVEQSLGALILLLVLLDVFLTVLYARAGTGVISDRLARWTWRLFRAASKPFCRNRGLVLAFCGPTILVLLVVAWALLLSLGAGMMLHPALGSGIRADQGETPTGLGTAIYVGGASMSIIGSSGFSPKTDGFRLLFLLFSLIGLSVTSLTLTYLMQVYTALRRRNGLALQVDLMSGETGDGAELLAALGPRGMFSAGYTNISTVAAELSDAKEAHHFYPVLFYFRFRNPAYSVSRPCLVVLDAVTLIESALDDARCAWIKEAAGTRHLGLAALRLVTTLEETFLPGGAIVPRPIADPATQTRWRERYAAALRRLERAGIAIAADRRAGAERYVALRAQWDPHIANLAPAMAYRREEIDPAVWTPRADNAPAAPVQLFARKTI